MESQEAECPVCGRMKPTNSVGVAISCCSRVPPLPMTAQEHSSILRVVRDRVDEALLAWSGHRSPSPLVGCALAAAVCGLILLALFAYAC